MSLPRKPLRVLLVEDSQDDADLTLLALDEGGFDTVSERVESETAMRAAMAGGNWDMVISDYNLPSFSASKAMAVLRETDANIPFIIVSNCIGEENTIVLMKEGANDFVMKDKLARLVPAVERELCDASMRRGHRLTQEALRASEKLLKSIMTSLGEGVFVMDGRGKLIFMNPEAERLLGWTEHELRGKDIHQIIHSHKPDGTPLPPHECSAMGVLSGGGVCRTDDDVFWRKDGSPISVSIAASAIVEGGKPVASVVAFQDITQRKQAECDLLESRRQLRELSSHLQTVREEERARIARELHDELGQMLTGVKLDAMWLAGRLSGERADVTDKVTSMSKLIDETLDAIRRVAADLRPVMLDDLGLAAAVEWLTEEFGKRTGIDVQLEMDMVQGLCDCQSGDCDLDAGVATAAFRIVQECLTNITRHALAEHVLVSLDCHADKLMLMVSDDGKGMDGESRPNSLGVIGMRERVHGYGGKFHLFSLPDGGTTVLAIIPIKLAEPEGATR